MNATVAHLSTEIYGEQDDARDAQAAAVQHWTGSADTYCRDCGVGSKCRRHTPPTAAETQLIADAEARRNAQAEATEPTARPSLYTTFQAVQAERVAREAQTDTDERPAEFDAALLTATARAKAAYPLEHERIERGLQIAIVGGVTLLPDGTALVQSQTHPTVRYQVNGHCTCVDAQHAPQGHCKHAWSKSLVKWAVKANADARRVVCPICCITDCGGCVIVEEPAEVEVQPVIAVPSIAPEHIVEIQGKRFVKFAGLLQLAHARGLTSLTATWTYNDGALSLASAVAVFPFGRFEEAGDASPDNVTKKVAPHFRRVALTRAKARVLRDALCISMVAVEELGE